MESQRGGAEREARLEDLLTEFIERREAGEALDPEAFAAQHGELADDLSRALRGLRDAEAQFPSALTDLPERIGRFTVLDEIGRGGMGRVLRVVDPESGRELALKVLHLALELEPRTQARFRREGEALERVRHPGVVGVVEVGLFGASPYIAMELVEGRSLADVLTEARRAEFGADGLESVDDLALLSGDGPWHERVARVVAALARAVSATHREGVLHRDIKPRNVLLRGSGEPVLIDFGLMRAEDTASLTTSGDILGTPQYMSPEQARGERVDQRSDVYGLGALLLELLTLTPPRAETETFALLRAVSTRPLELPRRRFAGLPRELWIIARRATEFLPRWRYEDAADLADDLERFLDRRPIGARAPGPLVRAVDFALGHRRTLVSFAAGVLVLLVVFFATRRDPGAAALRAGESLDRAVGYWLDGETDEARRAARESARWSPPEVDELDRVLLALVEGELPEDSTEPGLKALLDAERLRRAGSAREALEEFEVALNLNAKTTLTVVLTGLAAVDAGEWRRAEELFASVAHRLPTCGTLHRTLAQVYQELGMHADVVRAADTARRLDPFDPWLPFLLARARFGMGDLDGGLEAAGDVLEADPDWAVELAELASELEAEGQTEAALRMRRLPGVTQGR